VSLRIGFDLDGVLADMESALLRQAEGMFGAAATRTLHQPAREPPPSGDAPSDDAAETIPPLVKLDLTPGQQRRLWRQVASIENFWQSLEEIEAGIIARLAQLAGGRRWEIIFLTKRPQTQGATAQVQSQRWLESKGFPLPSVYVVQGSRGRIASALSLDIVIDDRPENCLDVVVDSEARAVLIWRDDQEALPAAARRLGITIVPTVAECLDALSRLTPSTRGGLSLLEQMKRLFGRKPTTDA